MTECQHYGFDFSGGLGSCEPILIQFWSVGVGGYAFVDGGILVRCGTDMSRLKFGHIVLLSSVGLPQADNPAIVLKPIVEHIAAHSLFA